MRPDRFIAYERVSTARLGRSGLGPEAQRKAIDDFAAAKGAEVLARFAEVESGRKADRAQLQAALTHAKLNGATLVIAKLDRRSRNAACRLAWTERKLSTSNFRNVRMAVIRRCQSDVCSEPIVLKKSA